ncbi:hypothetical protein ACWCW7_21060 [Nocardia tengchongensis]
MSRVGRRFRARPLVATDLRDASAGRRVFTGSLGDSRIRLTAVIESLWPAGETQPFITLP